MMVSALLPMGLAAQSVTGTITGIVTDSSGALVSGATVTITEGSTGIARAAATNSAGVFVVPLLQPGVYSVTVTKSGFETAERTGIELEVNQTANVNIPLAIGSTGQTVRVSGQAPLLNTEQVSLGTVIGAAEIEDLPLNGRQFIQLLQLVPGVAPVSVSQTGSALTIGNGAVNPSIGGATNRSNLFFINGVFATNPTYSYYAINPSADSIQEFQEQSHADEAEFGEATGGTVSVSTKSGTNQYHGSAYEFIRNDVFDAVPYFNSPGYFGGGKGNFKQNQFGATIGGPILKNKLFGFGNYEGYRYAKQSQTPTALPTAAELNGDFSALLGTTAIYDPATYNAVAGTAQQFPGNVIPTTRLDQPLISVIKAFLPADLPTTPYQLSPHQSNYVNTQSSTVTQNEFGIRVDYDITANDLLYGQYFYQQGNQSAPGSLPSNAFVTFSGGKNFGLNYIHTFSPTLVAQLTFGWLRATSPGYYVQNNAQQLFNTGGFSAGFTANPGDVSMAFIPSLGNDVFGIGSGEGGDVDTVYQYSGTVDKQVGKHALKFGAALYKATLNTNYAADGEGFGPQTTQNPAGAGGEEFAGMFMGLPTSASAQIGNSGGYLYETVMGYYAQDTWKLNPKFTVNYGLRWDYSAPVTDKGNRLSGFNQYNGQWYIPKGDVDAPSVIPAGVYTAGDHIAPNDYKNFSPRLGLAYLLTPKTSVRAGAGIFFDNWAGQIQGTQNARGSWPSGGSLSNGNTNEQGLSSPAVTAQQPFPGQSPYTAPTPFPGSGTFLDTHWRNAYSLQYNLQVERQIGNSQTVSLIYAGSSTSRGSITLPVNQPLNLGPTASEVLPFPNMSPGAYTAEIASIAHLSYNSFQSKYEKRFGNGLAIKGAFTWSKDIDVGCADFWEACGIQNAYNLRGERADSSLNLPLVMSASLVYKLPFGKGRQYLTSGLGSKLAGGWQLNGIFQHDSGSAYNPSLAFDNANSFVYNERYNVVGKTSGSKTLKQWFNTSAFVLPAEYTFGNGGRNDLRGPMYTDLDTSLFRTFPIYKEANFQFRAEFFNILNHPSFGLPNATCLVYNANGTCNLDPTSGDPNFGAILSQAGQSRQVQFAGKITF